MASLSRKIRNGPQAAPAGKKRRIAASEFKARCLRVMREIADTGSPVLITSRGEPLVEVIPARKQTNKKNHKDDFLGRLEGIIEIIGDPDDLIKPVFPLEDYDMLK